MRLLLAVIAMAFALTSVHAVEVVGVRFEDRVRLGDRVVVVNGAGLRKKAFFKIYAMALYLPERRSDGASIIALEGGKRIAIHLLRDVTAQQFIDALVEGVAENHSAAEFASLKSRISQFSDAMLSVGEAREGTLVFLDWLPGVGTRLTVDGRPRGQGIAGEDFYQALLRIWVGNSPVAEDLKQALLGKGRG